MPRLGDAMRASGAEPGCEMAVSGVAKLVQGFMWFHPQSLVPRLSWRSQAAQGAGHVDIAQLFSPKIILRHEDEPAKGPQSARAADTPPGLLEHLAMQGRNGRFARIDAAAGQLDIRSGIHLAGQEQLSIPRQQRVDPRPQPVSPLCLWRLSKTSDNLRPLHSKWENPI